MAKACLCPLCSPSVHLVPVVYALFCSFAFISVYLGERSIFLFSPVSPASPKPWLLSILLSESWQKKNLSHSPSQESLRNFIRKHWMIKNIQAPREKVLQQDFRLLSFRSEHLGGIPSILSVVVWDWQGNERVKSQPAGRNRRGGKGREQRNPGLRRKAGCKWLVPPRTC